MRHFGIGLSAACYVGCTVLTFLTLLPFLTITNCVVFSRVLGTCSDSICTGSSVRGLRRFVRVRHGVVVTRLVCCFKVTIDADCLAISLQGRFVDGLSLGSKHVHFHSALACRNVLCHVYTLIIVSKVANNLTCPLLGV